MSEQLFSWLGSFIESTLSLPITLPKNEFDINTPIEQIAPSPGLFRIYTTSNPGWELEFYPYDIIQKNVWEEKAINCGSNLINIDSNEWFYAEKRNDSFNTGGGPLSLSICLEAFHCFIVKKELKLSVSLRSLRKRLRNTNTLLCWLEEMYFSCCDTEWEHSYGYSIIWFTKSWIAIFSLEDLTYAEIEFNKVIINDIEGQVECYKLDGKFIIRAHPRGLITGIQIFKNWIESAYPVS